MSVPKRRPHPFMPPISERGLRFEPDAPRATVEAIGPDEDGVRCGLSGRWIRRADAVEMRLGPNRTMWVAADLTDSRR